MLKNYFLTIVLLINTGFLWAQTTAIPDTNFEQALIDLGIDSDGIINGSVLTSDISSITELDVSGKIISDLSGIEDFTSLKELECHTNELANLNIGSLINLENLYCYDNDIETLDISSNTNLLYLVCSANQLTDLDLSNNTLLKSVQCDLNYDLSNLNITNNNALMFVDCSEGQLNFIDISGKTELEQLICFNNSIKNIDVSGSTKLTKLRASNNQLETLNVNNGANNLLTDLGAFNNPGLACITVDDPDSANNFGQPYKDWVVDVGITFSSNCITTASIDDNILNSSVNIFPNPVSNILTIKSGNLQLTRIEVYSILGKKIKEINTDFGVINLSNLSSGLYLTRIYSEKGATSRKIIKN